MPPEHNLQTLPCGLWGESPPQEHSFYLEINYDEQNGYIKVLIGCVGEMVGVEGVLVAFQSLLTIKNGTSHSNFQSNEPFSKFLQQLLRYEVPWSEKKIHCSNIVLYLGSAIALPMIDHTPHGRP
jgi:hypothetical protein